MESWEKAALVVVAGTGLARGEAAVAPPAGK
jgi:hypothetical protein